MDFCRSSEFKWGAALKIHFEIASRKKHSSNKKVPINKYIKQLTLAALEMAFLLALLIPVWIALRNTSGISLVNSSAFVASSPISFK